MTEQPQPTAETRGEVAPVSSDAGADAVLRATNVTMRFGGLVANRDVDFVIPRRSIVSLIGPNGAGKTTFFNQMTGMLTPTSGDIQLDGTSIVGRSPHEIVELGIGRTFQNIRLFNEMSVLANVMVGRHVRMQASWVGSLLRLPAVRREEAETTERARELTEQIVKLYDEADAALKAGDPITFAQKVTEAERLTRQLAPLLAPQQSTTTTTQPDEA